MARFLIEVPHEPDTAACALAVKILLESGSHYLTHADFGCKDGVHSAWIIVEVDNKETARFILPPAYRAQAKIVKLNKFALEDMDAILKHHKNEM